MKSNKFNLLLTGIMILCLGCIQANADARNKSSPITKEQSVIVNDATVSTVQLNVQDIQVGYFTEINVDAIVVYADNPLQIALNVNVETNYKNYDAGFRPYINERIRKLSCNSNDLIRGKYLTS